ncbi:MAG: lysophospholipid acyltransferase family protein [Candidatus Promineifilaceae bacterium]|nr:lysophospholipid acyltransferase family protein [Candidatus Promineifilaceae bacterium]
MVDDQERTRCLATTRAGAQCKNLALSDMEYCHVHAVVAADPDGADPSGADNAPASSAPDEASTAPSEPELRRQMAAELNRMIEELEQASPDFTPPPFSPTALIDLIKQNLEQLPAPMRVDALYRLRSAVLDDDGLDMESWRDVWYLIHYWRSHHDSFFERLQGQLGSLPLPAGVAQRLGAIFNEDLLDPETWKGLWFMMSYSARYQADMVRRRFTGEYETDEWGMDWEFLDAVRPFFTFLYKYYWRVQTTGVENIPDYERALIVANHSGQLPFDGAMIGTAVLLEHPAQRLVRNLYADWFPTLPFLAPLLDKMGQSLASVENGTRLLENEELVAVYPEGYKGVGKLFKERYRLARFGRGGFVKMALKTQAPIIPTAVVGAEETYISLYKSRTLAQLTGFPYFPISLTWPWLGILGLVPLPTRWSIDFGEPLSMDAYPADAAENLVLVSQLTDQVRNIIQEMIYERLAERRSIFLG